ncbi:MAG: 3,4-dihydroxy-2-butanone-4-phosphate synthase, partial [Bacteroidales bacterium]|nr:3,4-dihydroxy-2-butanone-4-phosphate synthase [Bacteroidales bacterium]
MQESKLQSIEKAIEDLKAGKFVILVDDEERENEGDFIIAAQHIDAGKVNFMLTRGRGVLCVP